MRGVLAPPEGAADNCLEPGTLWGDSEQDLALATWFTAFTVSKTRRQLLRAGNRQGWTPEPAPRDSPLPSH